MNSAAECKQGSNVLAIKVIGVGSAGVNVVEPLTRGESGSARFAVLHTNARLLERSGCAEKVLLGGKRLRGLGAAGDPDLGSCVAEEEVEKLKALCSEADLILVAAGLGGGTATGVAPVLARVARENGALVLGVVALPFDFEGQRRMRQAQTGLASLRAAADAVLCLHNQHVSRLLDDQTRASEIFTAANELWAEGIGGILQMLTRRGLIQVEFADLAAMLRGRKAMSCFASVQVTGEARGKELMERLLVHPLLEGGRALLEADALLVNLTGGPDLTMADVNFVMDQVRRQSENAQFAMGASICDEFAGRLRVTIIAAKHGKPDDLAKDAVLSAGAETKASETSEDDRQIETQFFTPPELSRSSARFVPPPPDLSTEKKDQMFAEQSGKGGRVRRAASRLRQGQLPLEIVSKSRFEKSHPTIHRGEDLDVPTYIRRGIKLN